MIRRALIIGCPVGALQGVANDVAAMEALLGRHGFERDVVSGQDATRREILDRMERLIASSQPGDAAVIYYSGHGGRSPNLRPKAAQPDTASHREPHRYQFLIPVDIAESSTGDFRGILDLELSRILARLTQKTRNVTIIMDCCYAEGVMRPALPPRMRARARAFDPQIQARYDQIRAHLATLDQTQAPSLDPSSNPHAVKLWATMPDQIAIETSVGQGPCQGVLTRALCEVLDECHGQPVTWHAVHARVAAQVRKFTGNSQHPQLDGPGHRLLFELEEKPAIGTLSLGYIDGEPNLSNGRLAGVQQGDSFAIMPLSAQRAESERELARATVIEVLPERAHVVLDVPKSASTMPPEGSLAFPVAYRGPGRGVALACSPSINAQLARLISEHPSLALCRAPAGPVELVDEHVLAVLREPEPGLVQPVSPRGQPLAAPMPPASPLMHKLLRIQRAAIARSLESGTGIHALDIPVSIVWGRVHNQELHPAATIECGTSSDSRISMPCPVATLQPGERIYFEFANRDNKKITYWSVVDIDLDHKVELCTGQERGGIRIEPRQRPYVLGVRPHDRSYGRPIHWPSAVPREAANLRSFLFVITSAPHDMRALETADLQYPEIYSLVPDVREYMDRPKPPATRSPAVGTRPEEAPMRYTVIRLDFHLSRPERPSSTSGPAYHGEPIGRSGVSPR